MLEIKKIKTIAAAPWKRPEKTRKGKKNEALRDALCYVDPIIVVFQNYDGTLGYYIEQGHEEMDNAVKMVMRIWTKNNG